MAKNIASNINYKKHKIATPINEVRFIMNVINKTKLLYVILFFILISNLQQRKIFADDNSFKWQVGEELTYKVKWSFLRLGTLKLQICDTMKINSILVYHVKLFLDSNPLLFFVNMHSVYECYIDNKIRPHLFIAEEKIDDILYKTQYRFNYSDSLIFINMTDVNDTARTIEKEMPLDKRIFEGISLVFYARGNVHYKKSETLTAFFNGKKGDVTINFKGKNDPVELDAFDALQETYFVDGQLHLKGIAGLTGPFKGWFAVDNKSPPLKAELEVFLGNVKVELEGWKN